MAAGRTDSTKKENKYPNNYVRTPTVYQMEASECGAASLGMILGYYGCFVPLEKLRIETGVSRDGVNAKNMLHAARKYGLVCKGFTKTLEDTLTMKMPVIVHWNFNHFVVFEGVKGNHAYINDPAYGRRKLTIEEFDEAFTGVVLTFEKGEGFKKSKRPITLPQFVKSRAAEEEKPILWLFLSGLLLIMPGIMIPVLSQIFVDDILVGGNISWLGWLLVIMMATMLFQLVFTWLKSGVLMLLQAKVTLKSSYTFLSRLLRLPISFYDQRMAGDLVQRVDNNNNIGLFITGQMADVALSLILSVFYIVIMLLYSVPLTCIGLINILISVAMTLISSKTMQNFSMKSEQDDSKLTGCFYSGMAITSTLKASGAEKEYTARLLGYYAKNANNEQRIGRFQQIMSTVPQTIGQIIGILILVKGGEYVMRGALSMGMLTAFNQMLQSFTDPVNRIVGFFQQFQTLKADIARVEDIEKYELAEQFKSKERSEVQEQSAGDRNLMGMVEVRGISFGYSLLNKPLIENFSFKVTPGMSVAFVGASGCGKSTLAKIISGLYDPWEGEVLIDGERLRDIPPQNLHAGMAMVNQDITIFSGSIRENLTLWNPYVIERDLVNAAKDACIHDTITKLPGGYSYHLTEGGGNLSGGQRQRMEIARALTLNPSILILDEATSSLDAIIEKEIVENIRKRGCTCIVIAHRLSTIRDCDLIMIMDNGSVVQMGTHESMKDVDGPYRRLINNG